MTRTASYGSWFNFYLCDFDGRVGPVQHGTIHADYDSTRRGAADVRKVPSWRRGATPFRERNPVVIGAVGLAVIARHAAARVQHRRPAADRRRLAPGRAPRGRRAEGRQRGAGRRRQGRQGHGRSTSTGDHVRVDFRVGRVHASSARETAATIRIKTMLGQKYLALEPGGQGDLDQAEIPLAPHDFAVRRGGGVQRPRQHDRARSTPTQLAKALDTVADTFTDTPGPGPGVARRAGPAVPDRRHPGRRSCASCSQHAERRHRRAGRPQQGAGHAC